LIRITVLFFLLGFAVYMIGKDLDFFIAEIKAVVKGEESENDLVELKQAQQELQLAEQDFNFAEPEYIDIAALRLEAARMKYNNLILKKKVI
jgi:hypothetical protein